jgi:hypothetical protein
MTPAITLTLEDARLIGARLTRIRGPMSLEEYQAWSALPISSTRRTHGALFPAAFVVGPGGLEYHVGARAEVPHD